MSFASDFTQFSEFRHISQHSARNLCKMADLAIFSARICDGTLCRRAGCPHPAAQGRRIPTPVCTPRALASRRALARNDTGGAMCAVGTSRTPSPTERDRTCRRAGPACPAEKCVPGGGTHGSRPTGAYPPPKKNNAAPRMGRCRQAMSSAAARRRARRSERATGLFFTAGRMATPSSRRQGGSMARTVRFCWA